MQGKVPITSTSLGLPVSFVDREICPLFPYPDHLWIEGFSGTDAVPQGGEIELLEIGKDQHTVYRRRGAEDRDLVFFENRQELGRFELSPDIIHKDAGTLQPGPEKFPPRGLGPTGIGKSEVEIIWFQIQPEGPGNHMPEGKSMIVNDKFRFAGRPGRKVDHERIGASGPPHPFDLDQVAGDRGRVVEFLDIADPPREFCVGHQPAGQSRAIGADLLDFARILLVGDDHLDPGCIDPIFQVLWGEHGRAGTEDGTELDTGDRKDPPFWDPGEHDDHAVSLLHPVLQEHVCCRVGEVHHLPEGEGLLLSLLVHPDHREPVPVLQRKPIDHIKTEIIVFRNLQ